MGIFQRLLAALLTTALIGSLPVGAVAGIMGAAGCDYVAAATVDSGCCSDGSSMDDSGCSIVCGLSSAAVVGAVNEQLPGEHGESPIARPKQSVQRTSWPPDTAPPKPHSH